VLLKEFVPIVRNTGLAKLLSKKCYYDDKVNKNSYSHFLESIWTCLLWEKIIMLIHETLLEKKKAYATHVCLGMF